MRPMTMRTDRKPNYVYVASSWRNPLQVAVCAALKSAGIDHYDFKNPPHGKGGFHWSEVMPSFKQDEQLADMDEYIKALDDPISRFGFEADMNALNSADCTILILPCGRSAHLELGFAVGEGQATAILLDGAMHPENKVTPELMYRMVDYVAPSLFDLLGWLGVED